jgi:hypothetical protein
MIHIDALCSPESVRLNLLEGTYTVRTKWREYYHQI